MAKARVLTFSSSGFDKRASRTTTIRYASGQAIFSQGDTAAALFRVEDGHVKLTVRSKHGKKAVIAVLGAGECFGEGCLEGNGNVRRSSTATSVQGASIARVAKGRMLRRLRAEPALARLLTSHLLLRVARSEEDHAGQMLHSSEQRLARLLLRLADFTRPRGALHGIKLDQRTLSQMVGTTRSRVSFFMNRFRDRGFIEYRGGLKVYKGLRTFLEQGSAAA